MNSPQANAGPKSPISAHRKRKRKGVRNATFILPSGERIHRQITLRNPDFPEEGLNSSELGNALLPMHNANKLQSTSQNIRETITESWQWINSGMGRSVLKCSIAYAIGSLAVFVPQVSNFLGAQDGKHMVATITCYFNPARSAGGMLEGVLLGLAAFVYAAFICVASMTTSVVCDTWFDLIELGYILVLVVFCGGGLGLVGWAKQKLNGPLVSVACSLASLAIITVLTKENAIQTAVFSDEKISQVLKMVIMGMFATTAVCLLLWPISARSELRQTMIKVTDSFGDMLTMITRSFLSGSEDDLLSPHFEDTASRYKTVFNQLSKNLKEAKFEHYFLGTEDEYLIEKKLVECMRRLAQAVGGLRSAAATQFTLLNEKHMHGSSTPLGTRQYSMPQIHTPTISATIKSKQDRFAVLSAIDEVPDEADEEPVSPDSPRLVRSSSSYSANGLPTVRTPAEIFERFILHLGPSVKSLAWTLSQILLELPFGEKPLFKITINEQFTTSLADAVELYTGARNQALGELYKSKEMLKDRPESVEADFEEVAASCGHFSFSLQDIAEEMQNYLDILNQLKEEVEGPNRRSWKWLKFWREKKRHDKESHDPAERESLIHHNAVETYRAQQLPDIKLNDREFRPIGDHITVRKWLLNVSRALRKDDIRFPIKVGLGAALWAMFAFIPETRPFYKAWRGEWGLISYMLVCSMTVGASNTTGIGRFGGTMLGAILAIIVWNLCQGNVWALWIMGWLISFPCFYIIVKLNKGPLGRFILLTYNLSCLYAYSLSVKEGAGDDEDEGGANPIITEITLHRVVATMGGCLWGLIITRVIWPISARKKFKDGLSVLWLRMGLIWKRDPLSVLLEDKDDVTFDTNVYMNLREEYALQGYVSKLENLRVSAASEFELRGPFREKQYGRILASTSRMLDAFHAMNVVMMKDTKASEGQIALLKYTADERAELCKRISHLFQVMASSLSLSFPLNDALPSTSNARDRLLSKIFHFRKTEASQMVKDEDYALLYAFALVTGQLREEIAKVGAEVEGLFGVLDEEALELR